jgi:hypothetical protein
MSDHRVDVRVLVYLIKLMVPPLPVHTIAHFHWSDNSSQNFSPKDSKFLFILHRCIPGFGIMSRSWADQRIVDGELGVSGDRLWRQYMTHVVKDALGGQDSSLDPDSYRTCCWRGRRDRKILPPPQTNRRRLQDAFLRALCSAEMGETSSVSTGLQFCFVFVDMEVNLVGLSLWSWKRVRKWPHVSTYNIIIIHVAEQLDRLVKNWARRLPLIF